MMTKYKQNKNKSNDYIKKQNGSIYIGSKLVKMITRIKPIDGKIHSNQRYLHMYLFKISSFHFV